ncbi:oxidoreductase, partial [Pseudomonas sp. MWU13-2860]
FSIHEAFAKMKTVCCLLVFALLAQGCRAGDDPVLLVVSGKFSHCTEPARGGYEFAERALMALPQTSLVPATSWRPTAIFSGPLVRDILNKVGAYGHQAQFVALNDYTYSIPVSELVKYRAILARRFNQQPMNVARYGPLWLMYPLEQRPDSAKGPALAAKLIWQIVGPMVN